MARTIDLTLPIRKHWRWPAEVSRLRTYEHGDGLQTSRLAMDVHGFTHVDSPRHFIAGGPNIDQVPLDAVMGEAAVVDLSDKGADEGIGAADLDRAGQHVRDGDIALLKTGWDRRRSWESMEYWSEAPYLTAEGAEWLAGHGVKAVGCDFPQDYAIRKMGVAPVKAEEFVVHQIFLSRGILNVEYLTNLHALTQERVWFCALPLKIEGAEGAPTRAVAVLG